MHHVIVTGSLGYDYIMDFPGRFVDRIMPDKIHKISLGFLADKLNKQFGGTAVNIAYTLKLLGLDPQILAPAGNDFAPIATFLRSHGLSAVSIPVYKDEPCGCSFVLTDQDDNQIGSYYMGAIKYAKKLSLFPKKRSRNSIDFVVLSPTEPEAMKKYVAECRQQTLGYMYDPAFQIDNFTADELQKGIEKAEILIGNDYEVALIEQKVEVSHEELVAMVPILITTLGSKGSIIETRREAIHIRPAKPKNTSDPTGAGDAYRAGFLAGYLTFAAQHLRGERIRTSQVSQKGPVLTTDELVVCGQMGSVAAVYTVEKYGTVTHHFTKKELAKRYEENYHQPLKI